MPKLSVPPVKGLEVSGVTADSRAVKRGSLFVAVRGTSGDGHAFLAQAASAGAAAAVGEEPAPKNLAIPYFQVPDSRLALARIAADFYGNPSFGMKMVGVTGTSGKTTTTYFIESILAAAGMEPGVIGTVNIRYGSTIVPATHTTPGPEELQRILAEMKAAGCKSVVMEVSSHALKQHRTACIAFDAVVFTNLSPEHLDFHPDMEDYYRSKAMLFKEYADYSLEAGKAGAAIINYDDEYGQRLARESRYPVHGFGLAADAQFNGAGLKADLAGIHGEVTGMRIDSDLVGGFNVHNLLGGIGAAESLGVGSERIRQGVALLKGVPGRLERVANERGIHVFVDYAHKLDALKKVLGVLQSIRAGGRLITVMGCGGDRDRLKRPKMGLAAWELSDHVWVTSDNPRTEDPDAIIQEILVGIPVSPADRARVSVDADRRKAISGAIGMAKSSDVVLIAGKGHEDYQILGTRKIHFDDREIASEALRFLDTGF